MEPQVSKVQCGEHGLDAPFPASLRRIASIAAIISTLASSTSCAFRSGQSSGEVHDFGGRDAITLRIPNSRSYTEKFRCLSEARQGDIALTLAATLQRLSRGDSPAFVAAFCTNPSDWRDLISCAGAQLESANPLDRADVLRTIQYRQLLQILGEKLPGALSARCDAFISKELSRLAAVDLNKDPINELDLALRFIHRVRGVCGAKTQAECDRTFAILDRRLGLVLGSTIASALQMEINRQESNDSNQLTARRRSLGKMDLFGGITSPITRELTTFLALSPRWEHSREGWRCVECPSGSRWILEAQLDSDEEDSYLALRREDNSAIVIKLPLKSVARCIIEGREETLFAKAYESYERGESSANILRLRGLDFSHSGSTLYLPVFPREFNQVISANLVTSTLLARTLEEHYGTGFIATSRLFTENPKEDIEAALRVRLSEHSAKAVFLDLYAHGSDKGAHFGPAFSASDLCDLVKRFSQHSFVVKTIACYGGGMREGLEREFAKNPDLRSRITLIVETRPELVNELSTVGDHRSDILECNHIRGSRFQNYLLRALLSDPKKNLGDAIREADRLTREHSGYDPEVLQNGELISALSNPGREQAVS